jgi:hypothetical protein
VWNNGGTKSRGNPDDGSRYYEHRLAALERLFTAKALSNPSEMLVCRAARIGTKTLRSTLLAFN